MKHDGDAWSSLGRWLKERRGGARRRFYDNAILYSRSDGERSDGNELSGDNGSLRIG
jgi:hypothetical protein